MEKYMLDSNKVKDCIEQIMSRGITKSMLRGKDLSLDFSLISQQDLDVATELLENPEEVHWTGFFGHLFDPRRGDFSRRRAQNFVLRLLKRAGNR